MLTKYRRLPWPCNLWSTVLMEEFSAEGLPADWEAALERVFTTIRYKRARELLLSYFREKLTLQQIGERYGITKNTVLLQINKTVAAMRLPGRRIYLVEGLENGEDLLRVMRADRELLDRTSVMYLNLSERARHGLMRANISTVGQLKQCSDEKLLQIRCLGKKALAEIKGCLDDLAKYESLKSGEAGDWAP